MLNILFISPSFYPATFYGGPIYSTYELAKALKKQNINIKVITTNANGNDRLKVKTCKIQNLDNDLPVKYYKSLDSRGTSLSMLFNLYKEIKSADIIYLISIFSPPTPFTILICKMLNKPVIISPRGQLGAWCLAQGNQFKKLWLSAFTKPYIVQLYWHLTSEAEEDSVLAFYPVAKTFVISNGIEIEKTETLAKRKDKLFYKKYCKDVNENSKVIISIGRLQKVKGFDILTEAFEKVQKLVPKLPDDKAGLFRDSILFIAGEDFGEKSDLLNLISSKHLEDKIFLVGHIEGEDKLNFLKNADVFALPSYHENFGMAIAEALACGIPVITTRGAPWQELETHNAGWWIDIGAEPLAKALTVAMQLSDNERMQMGLNGRKLVEEKYSIEIVAKKMIQLYEWILYKSEKPEFVI